MRKYAIASVPIGLMEVVDAWRLAQGAGAITASAMTLAAIEFAWAIASLVVWIRVRHPPTRYLAAAFFLYNLAGWAFAFFSGIPESGEIPLWLVYAAGIFGLSYTAASVYVATRP